MSCPSPGARRAYRSWVSPARLRPLGAEGAGGALAKGMRQKSASLAYSKVLICLQ